MLCCKRGGAAILFHSKTHFVLFFYIPSGCYDDNKFHEDGGEVQLSFFIQKHTSFCVIIIIGSSPLLKKKIQKQQGIKKSSVLVNVKGFLHPVGMLLRRQ